MSPSIESRFVIDGMMVFEVCLTCVCGMYEIYLRLEVRNQESVISITISCSRSNRCDGRGSRSVVLVVYYVFTQSVQRMVMTDVFVGRFQLIDLECLGVKSTLREKDGLKFISYYTLEIILAVSWKIRLRLV